MWNLNKTMALIALVQSTHSMAAGLVAHEWGTFTSLQGSNGRVLEGLHHEEENLPDFVHSLEKLSAPRMQNMMLLGRDGAGGGGGTPQPVPPRPPRPPRCGKGACLDYDAAITQKLETPVIYFYSDRNQKVKVDVDFPEGVISQWYPAAESFKPAPGIGLKPENGQMSWTIDVVNEKLPIPYVSPRDIWAPSREVNSAYVRSGNENEKFIFYRGLGKFDVPFEVRSNGNGLTLVNGSEQAIPAAFLLRMENGRGVVQSLGPVAARGSLNVDKVPQITPSSPFLEEYLNQATSQLERALVASGLYLDESRAMVNTWRQSYFLTPGLRILYVVPREWTDRLLPLRISPQPSETVRTLVGRVEVFQASEEHNLLERLTRAARANTSVDVSDLGRFAEPKLRRVLELTQDAQVRSYAERLIQSLQ